MPDERLQVPLGLTTEGLLGRRYLARVIDSVVIIVTLILALALLRHSGIGSLGDGSFSSILLVFFVSLILWVGYGALLESSLWQATLGKRLMGLRVYDSQGRRLRVMHAAKRSLVKEGPFILLGAIPAGRLLSFVWLGAHIVVLHRSPVYQATHDRVAQTWVAAPEATIQLHLA